MFIYTFRRKNMPEFTEHCPECNSDDIVTFRKRKLNRCEDCGHEWRVVHYTEAAEPDVEDFCKALAASAVFWPM